MNASTSHFIPKELKEMIDSLYWALIVVVIFRSFILEPFKIPSGSMIPTLKVGDHILVKKFTYAVGLPVSKIKIYERARPKKGEVVIFLYPRDESRNFIKRLVGEPGDTVEIVDGRLKINGQFLKIETATAEERKILSAIGSEYDLNSIDLYKEYLNPLKWHWAMYDRSRTAPFNVNYMYDENDDGIPDPIPQDHYFVMGDNRDNSSDSRIWGLVPWENFKGQANSVWLSLDEEQSWFSIDKLRWKEMFRFIE